MRFEAQKSWTLLPSDATGMLASLQRNSKGDRVEGVAQSDALLVVPTTSKGTVTENNSAATSSQEGQQSGEISGGLRVITDLIQTIREQGMKAGLFWNGGNTVLFYYDILLLHCRKMDWSLFPSIYQFVQILKKLLLPITSMSYVRMQMDKETTIFKF